MKSKTTRPLFQIGGRIAFILILLMNLALAHAQDCTTVTADGVQDTNIPSHQWKVELYQGFFGVQGALTEPGYVNSYSEHLDHEAGSNAFGTPVLREEAYTDLAALPFAFADQNIPSSDNPFDSAIFDSRADIGSGFDPVLANGGWQMIISRTATVANDITIGLPGSYIDDHVELFVDGVLVDDIIGFRSSLDAADVITYTTAPGEVIEIRLTNREGLGGFNLYINSPSLDRDNNAIPDACQTDDFDADGVPDSVDLDDDNDGILDTEECTGNTSTANMTGDITDSDTSNYPLSITGNGISGGPTPGGVFLTDITLGTTLNGGDVYESCEFIIIADDFDDGFQTSVDGTQVLYFDQSNWDNTFGATTTEFNTGGLFDSDNSGRWTPWTGEGNPQLVLKSNGEISLMVDTKAPGVRLNALPYMDSTSAGWILNTSFSFSCLTGVNIVFGNANDNGVGGVGQITNTIVTANVYVCPDADGNSVSNGRDNDSDGDGCPDALEAAGTFTAVDLDANNRFIGSVDENGIPDITSGGQASTTAVLDAGDASACPPIAGADSDGDGIDDDVDLDDDNDGILDTVEGVGDTDGDGIIDSLDLDSDNDGVPDITEAGGVDTDGDGQVDYPTPGDPMSMVDTNNDGLDDGVAANPLADEDSDGDGLEDRIDLDSDNDGIPDVIEAGGTDIDGDGIIDGFTDSDDDGLSDNVDPIGPAMPGTPLPHEDTDGDGVKDRVDLDSDNDGITDVIEAGGPDADGNGRIDMFVDADGDGFSDSVDTDDSTTPVALDGSGTALPRPNFDNDTRPNYLDIDSDNDGITDATESTNLGGEDADGDGEIDNFTDANGDGFNDDTAANPITINNQDGTGGPDYLDIDNDDDGIVDNIEGQSTAGYIPPLNLDSDNDGLDDAYDTATGGTGINPVQTAGIGPDYLIRDTDGDGIDDIIEGWDVDADGIPEISPLGSDADSDGLDDAFDTDDTTPDPTNGQVPTDFPDAQIPGGDQDWREPLDSDGDGVIDSQEVTDGTDPSDPCDFVIASITVAQGGDYMMADCDGDGVPNSVEIRDGTNPEDPCDFNPTSVSVDPSGDYLISDCDGDGVINGTELVDGTDPADPCSFNESNVTLDQMDPYLTADCDGDTIPNGQEITDGTNPNDPCSSRGGVPPDGITCDIIIDNELVGPQVDDGFFRIGNIEAFPNNTVQIYNRWGILVYETTGYDSASNNFRGFSQGRATISEDKALPVGVYFYVIDFMNNGTNTTKSGYLYVNR